MLSHLKLKVYELWFIKVTHKIDKYAQKYSDYTFSTLKKCESKYQKI